MKTASELISFLVKDKHFSLCSVCELHKPCATTPRCSWEPAKRFVNFDDVKTAYCKEHQMISCASVDGLSGFIYRYWPFVFYINVSTLPNVKTDIMDKTKLTREEALRRWEASKETKRKMLEKLENLEMNAHGKEL